MSSAVNVLAEVDPILVRLSRDLPLVGLDSRLVLWISAYYTWRILDKVGKMIPFHHVNRRCQRGLYVLGPCERDQCTCTCGTSVPATWPRTIDSCISIAKTQEEMSLVMLTISSISSSVRPLTSGRKKYTQTTEMMQVGNQM